LFGVHVFRRPSERPRHKRAMPDPATVVGAAGAPDALETDAKQGRPFTFRTPTKARLGLRPKTTPVQRKLSIPTSPTLDCARALSMTGAAVGYLPPLDLWGSAMVPPSAQVHRLSGANAETTTSAPAPAPPAAAAVEHLPPLDLWGSALVAHEAASAPVHTLSGANAQTTTPAPAPAQAAADPVQSLPTPTTPAATNGAQPTCKIQLRTHDTVSHPAPPPAKRTKHIAKPGPIEVTRAEMAPLVRALAQWPSDEEQLVHAAIGFLVAAPMAYRAVYV
jgi:hypothetical protein